MSVRLIIKDTLIAKMGDLPINIILSYLSRYEICTYSEIPDDWKFISLLGTGSDYKFYKLNTNQFLSNFDCIFNVNEIYCEF